MILDGFLYFRKAENWQISTQFTITHDVFTRRIDVNSVRRLRAGNQIKEVVILTGINQFYLIQNL